MAKKTAAHKLHRCPRGRAEDLGGQRFGRLSVTCFAGRRGKHPYWTCVCDCGQVRLVAAKNLKAGFSRSCGCMSHTHPRYHGRKSTPEYQTWKRIARNSKWHSFAEFVAAVGKRPSSAHTLRRADVTRPFGPDNAQWTTSRLGGSRAQTFSVGGFCGTVGQWAVRLGISRQAVHYRLKRYPPSVALGRPAQAGGPVPLDRRHESAP